QITSATPSAPVANGSGSAAGSGQQFPNLFGLGAGRTLSLVNGRRFVTSSSGMGDRVVDTNLIPVGLLERVDVVQAGGAAVYGSDAIAGVINYVLKDDFEGLEVDAQYGISSRDDYPQTSLRMTFGDNFLDGRANLAGNVEWSKSDALYGQDRPRSNLSRLTVSNAANTGPSDGVPAVRELLDAHFWPFNTNGLIFSTPAPV
ncbi:MAG: TonB-dependent receptor plug domain-containing protein, partial [Hyphomonas sp.]